MDSGWNANDVPVVHERHADLPMNEPLNPFDQQAANDPGISPLIMLRGVSKSFDGVTTVLEPSDLTVSSGDFISLIGPSGCGKTTLLKLVAGLLKPTAGSIEFAGFAAQVAGRLAYVFQDSTLLPWLTVQDNVALPLRIAGARRDVRLAAVASTLELVGLAHAAGLYPRELSGGMKMRVSIARALTLNPSLLLLDEPFGALDEMSRDRLNEELLRLREVSRWTAMFVTHSVAEAVFLSSRVVVLAPSPGRIANIVPIPLPYPRTAATRSSRQFAELVLTVTRALHAVQAVAPATEAERAT